MVLGDQNCYQDACPLMGGCMPSIYFLQKEWSLWCYGGVNWLLSLKGFINHQSIGYCMWCKPRSYNRGYVHFCVPWILEVFTNDPCAGTTNDCLLLTSTLHLCRSMLYMQAMILMRSCRLWGLAIASVDGWCLYIIIQLYIAWYLVVKISMLIWQVNTKRNNSKIFANLLV